MGKVCEQTLHPQKDIWIANKYMKKYSTPFFTEVTKCEAVKKCNY